MIIKIQNSIWIKNGDKNSKIKVLLVYRMLLKINKAKKVFLSLIYIIHLIIKNRLFLNNCIVL